MRRFGLFWGNLAESAGLMDPAGVQTPAGGELRPRDGGAVPPEVLYFIILYTYALSRQNTSAWIRTPNWVGLP